GQPERAIAFLRRVEVTPADIADDDLSGAGSIIHLAAPEAAPIDAFCAQLSQLLPGPTRTSVLRGVVRPPVFTGAAMHDFAYAHQVLQQPGTVMPEAFLVPLKKSPEWWAMDWMQRHTYLLPRYDDGGRMVSRGHALAAAPGIACLMRRTYRNAT